MWDLNAEALCVFQLTCRILAQGLSERQALTKLLKGDCHSALASHVSFPSAYSHLTAVVGIAWGSQTHFMPAAPASDASDCLLQGLFQHWESPCVKVASKKPLTKEDTSHLQMDSPRRCFQSTFSYNKGIQNTPSSCFTFTVSLCCSLLSIELPSK